MSVPGRGCKNQSAAAAVAVRIGSITTTLVPSARASSMVGQRWRLVSLVFVAQRMISLACRISSGSMPRLEPFVIETPAPTVGPQIARTRRLAPRWLKKRLLRPWRERTLWLPASLNGSSASAPWVSITSCSRTAISASAASHDTCSNSPLPFGPVRRSGWRMRSGLYTRSRKRLTLGHNSPLLYGCAGSPRNLTATGWAALSSTVTVHPHESGQSW